MNRLKLGSMVITWTLTTGYAAYAQMASMPMSHNKAPATPSTSLTLRAAGRTVTLSAVDLDALPQETVSVMNAHLKKTETYSGVPIAALLAKLGLPFEKSAEPVLLKSYLIVKGTDGYSVVVSVYEALTAVHQGTAIVADRFEGKPLGPDGAFKLILSSDKRPQRWVHNLASISLETVP